MRRFVQNLAVKIIAFLLIIVLVFVLFVSALGVYIMIKNDVYYDGGIKLKEDIFSMYSDKYAYITEDVVHSYLGKDGTINSFEEFLDPNISNYRYRVEFSDGKFIASNLTDGEDVFNTYNAEINCFVADDEVDRIFYVKMKGNNYSVADYISKFEADGNYRVLSWEMTEEDSLGGTLKLVYRNGSYQNVRIESYVLKEPAVNDILYFNLKLAQFAIGMREAVFIYAAIALLAVIFLFIILLCGSGHKNGYEGIYLSKFNRIYFDVYLAFNVVLAYFAAELFAELCYWDLGVILGFCFIVPLYTAQFLGICLTFAARIKADGWYKNTLVYVILRLLFKGIKKALNICGIVVSRLSLLYKTILIIVLFVFLEILFMIFGMEDYVPFWVLEKIILIPLIIYCVLCMRRLQRSARRLALGETDHKTNTEHLVYDFKEHAENLNGISEGLSLALEESIKSERMKTELITNVSHDIKTPLTSIINYVDLMKREGLDSENSQEYLEVLDRQSARLKRLIEDLIEASKASSGNVNIVLEKTDVKTMLMQTAGEYEEKFNEKGLSIVIDCKEDDIFVDADGRHLFRVFDNLMNNIYKYAQGDTRVYLSAKKKDGRAEIAFKNISKEALNIDPSELTERFVRGDKSRNTEGSGLGLSIAKSLIELQNGTFEIKIDGDLFKVLITL